MKQPVHPKLFKAKQERNWNLIQFAASAMGLVAIAIILITSLWFAWGKTEAIIAVSAIGVAIAFVPAAACVAGVLDSVIFIVDNGKSVSAMQNEMAWNSQQEELDRLRTIMKEEGL